MSSPSASARPSLVDIRQSRRNAGPRGRQRGRPRDTRRHAAILDAARQLILEVGYTRVTLDAIARRSGASRTTLYEWWGHRAPLVAEALFEGHRDRTLPDTGGFDGDLAQLVEELVSEMTRPEVVRAFPALVVELESTPELDEECLPLHDAFIGQRWQRVFERAVARGELRQSVRADVMLRLVLGAAWMLSHDETLASEALAPYLLCATRAVLASEPPR